LIAQAESTASSQQKQANDNDDLFAYLGM